MDRFPGVNIAGELRLRLRACGWAYGRPGLFHAGVSGETKNCLDDDEREVSEGKDAAGKAQDAGSKNNSGYPEQPA